MEMINFKKKKMKLLKANSRNHMEMQRAVIFVRKKLKINMLRIKNILKLDIIIQANYTGKYRGAAHSMCNSKYSLPKQIAIIFHNASRYDYHFIINKLAIEFKGQFLCLEENTVKYITLQF